jgi:hypothetical protein
MDDSNDKIRIETAHAFTRYFASMPKSWDSSQYDYLVRGLLVHVDDSNPDVQQAVMPALAAAAVVEPSVFIEIVEECKRKHRTQRFCDELVVLAKTM